MYTSNRCTTVQWGLSVMARAPYDTSCDLITGPGTPVPGVPSLGIACRYVRELLELPITDPLTERVAYVTLEAVIPVGPGVTGGPGEYTVDYDQADLLAIPSGSSDYYQVLFVEHVAPRVGGVYYRAHVRLSPYKRFLAQENGALILQEEADAIVVT